MKSLHNQLLSILLMFLLGLSPLQPLLAGDLMSVGGTNKTCKMPVSDTPMHHDMQSNHEAATQDCEHCTSSNECNEVCCSSSHCSSHASALLSSSFTLLQSDSPFTLFQLEQKTVNKQPLALFRPPRA